jgi:hypothetical protein
MAGHTKQFMMETNDFRGPDDGFSMLSQEEQFEMYGGSYKGPILPHVWLQFILEKLKNRED